MLAEKVQCKEFLTTLREVCNLNKRFIFNFKDSGELLDIVYKGGHSQYWRYNIYYLPTAKKIYSQSKVCFSSKVWVKVEKLKAEFKEFLLNEGFEVQEF